MARTPEYVLLLFVACVAQAAVMRRAEEIDFEEADWEERSGLYDKGLNTVSSRVGRNGELQTRVSRGPLVAVDTFAPELLTRGIFYRHLTNGKSLIQFIYQGHKNLIDCDVTKNEETIRRFLSGADDDGVNSTMRGDNDLTAEELAMVDINHLVRECRDLQRRLQDDIDQEKNTDQHRMSNQNHLSVNMRNDKRSGRSKRSMLIYPGTLWCGKGSTANRYEELGDNPGTDKCCRDHDHCPYLIEGFTTKYNYFNYRFTTLSHCSCDQTFWSCLKSADNNVAHDVGDFYFNKASTDCFIFKAETSCERRSWWGKCEKFTKSYTAVVEKPLVY